MLAPQLAARIGQMAARVSATTVREWKEVADAVV